MLLLLLCELIICLSVPTACPTLKQLELMLDQWCQTLNTPKRF